MPRCGCDSLFSGREVTEAEDRQAGAEERMPGVDGGGDPGSGEQRPAVGEHVGPVGASAKARYWRKIVPVRPTTPSSINAGERRPPLVPGLVSRGLLTTARPRTRVIELTASIAVAAVPYCTSSSHP